MTRAASTSRPVVVCLTQSGLDVGTRAAAALDADLHGRAGRVDAQTLFDETTEHLRALFAAGRPIIGVCAGGILIRALAPLIAAKTEEPPVLALAEDGSSIVPLLGGHRGANALAKTLSEALGAHPAVTTAGDLRLGVPLDAPPPGWRLANPEDAAAAMAAALSGAEIKLEGWAAWLAPLATRLGGRRPERPDIETETETATETEAVFLQVGDRRLTYRRADLALGLGCERGAETDELWALVESALVEAGASPGAVAGVFSINLKSDEAAIAAVARRLGAPARFFDAARLEAERPRLANPSEVVFAEVGCHGVAEGAALAAVGPGGALILEKRKSARATCALARAPSAMIDLPGARRGRLSVVGAGPGFAEGRTPEVSRAIAEADELVGYGLYIDLLGPLAAGKTRSDFPLGGEEARCRHALERAGEGRKVALICQPFCARSGASAAAQNPKPKNRTWPVLELLIMPPPAIHRAQPYQLLRPGAQRQDGARGPDRRTAGRCAHGG